MREKNLEKNIYIKYFDIYIKRERERERLLNRNPLLSFKGFASSEIYVSIHVYIFTFMHEWPPNLTPTTASVANPNQNF